jgi:hypothetical protein
VSAGGRLAAKRAIAFVEARAQIDVGLEADRPAVAAPRVGLDVMFVLRLRLASLPSNSDAVEGARLVGVRSREPEPPVCGALVTERATYLDHAGRSSVGAHRTSGRFLPTDRDDGAHSFCFIEGADRVDRSLPRLSPRRCLGAATRRSFHRRQCEFEPPKRHDGRSARSFGDRCRQRHPVISWGTP